MRLLRRAAALLEVAGRAGRRDIFQGRPPAGAARNDMVEGQVVRGAAILAGEVVAQEKVAPGEGGMFRRLHVLLRPHYRNRAGGPGGTESGREGRYGGSR